LVLKVRLQSFFFKKKKLL